MILVKDVFCTLWKSENKGKYINATVSTSEKDRQDETKYKNSNWRATFVGKALDQINGLPEKTRLKILSGKLTNELQEYQGEKKSFLTLVVFDVEVVGGSQASSNPPPSNRPTSAPKNTVKPTENQGGNTQDEDDLPF